LHRSSVNAEEKQRDNRLIQVHLKNKNGKGDDGKSSLFHFTSSVWQWHWTAEDPQTLPANIAILNYVLVFKVQANIKHRSFL